MGGTPKSSILMVFSCIFHYKPSSYGGIPIYGNLHISILKLLVTTSTVVAQLTVINAINKYKRTVINGIMMEL